jgi:RND family efflux transporter MFP subunit
MKVIRKILKGVIYVVILGGLGWAAITFWPRTEEPAVAQSSYTGTFAASRGTISSSLSLTGQVYTAKTQSLNFNTRSKGTKLTEVLVSVGDVVHAGDVLATIDTTSLVSDLDTAETNLLSAEEALEDAQAPYTTLQEREAEAAVTQARVELEAARENLEDLLAPDLDEAAEAVTDAQQALQQARDDLSTLNSDRSIQENIAYLQWRANEIEAEHGQLVNNASENEQQRDYRQLIYNQMMDAREAVQRADIQARLDVINAEYAITRAETALADAQQRLADLEAGPDELDVRTAKLAAAQAEYGLKEAEERLATIQAGPDESAIKLAQSGYDSARAIYDDALAALEGAVMVAPFDGTIMTVNAEVGNLVSSNAILTLADLTNLRVLASVDETEITQVEIGQAAIISFDAFPDATLQGEVLEVPIEGALSSNVVYYEVPISMAGGEDLTLKPGMTANISLLAGQAENALLIPVMAVQISSDGYVVTVQNSDGSTTLVPIKIGLNDGVYVQVVSGLIEGDVVVVEYQASETTTTFGNFGGGNSLLRMFGGR